MMYCHKCLRKIHFWESRAEGCHIRCLPIERRCKYYHIQRDMHTSTLFALVVCVLILVYTKSIVGQYVGVITGIFVFLFSSIIAGRIREKEEDERNE